MDGRTDGPSNHPPSDPSIHLPIHPSIRPSIHSSNHKEDYHLVGNRALDDQNRKAFLSKNGVRMISTKEISFYDSQVAVQQNQIKTCSAIQE